MSDIITVKEEMNQIDKILEEQRATLDALAERKARTKSEYEKSVAVTILKLKAGASVMLDGVPVTAEGLAGNLVEKVAKGICYKELYAAEGADGAFAAARTSQETLRARLNGKQSELRLFE